MSRPLAPQAGSALLWRASQLIVGRGVSLARFLILAALLVPEAFGLLAIAVTAVDFVMAITEFGMQPALVQRRERRDVDYDVAWTVLFVRGIVVSVVVVLAAPWIASLFDQPDATNVIRLLALRPLIQSAASIRTTDLARRLDFRSLTLISVPAVLVEALVSIGLAGTWGVWALVAGALAGAATSTVLSYVFAPYRPRIFFDQEVAAELFRFGRWILATGLVGFIAGAVIHLVISRRFGVTQLGVYYLALRLALLPNEILSDVVRDVSFPVHAQLQTEPGPSGRVFRSALVAMLALLGPIYGALFALAPPLTTEVLGAGWEGTASIIRILSIVGVIGVISDAAMPMLSGHGRPDLVTVLFSVRTVVVLALILPLSAEFGLDGAAWAWLSAEVVVQVGALIFSARVVENALRGLSARVVPVVVASLAAVGLAAGSYAVFGGAIGVFVAGAFGVLAAMTGLGVADHRRDLGLGADLAKLFPSLAPFIGREAPS